jgi:hypothetical protein
LEPTAPGPVDEALRLNRMALAGLIETSMTVTKLWDWMSVTAALVGVFGFLGGAVVAMAGNRLPLQAFEFPLGDVQGVDVDREGNVVLALGFYGRIQLYDANGRFRRSWSADALGGSFTVCFQSPDLVASYAGRRGSTIVYNLAGERVREDAEPARPKTQSAALSIEAPDRSRVTVHRRLFWPKVVRDKGGVTSTLVEERWYMRLAEGPLATWLLFCGGGLLNRHVLARIRATRAG